MYATSPYSDPVVLADIDPQPIIDEEEGLIWVVGPVLAVVFIICIVIAILLYKRWAWTRDSRVCTSYTCQIIHEEFTRKQYPLTWIWCFVVSIVSHKTYRFLEGHVFLKRSLQCEPFWQIMSSRVKMDGNSLKLLQHNRNLIHGRSARLNVNVDGWNYAVCHSLTKKLKC